MSAMATIRFDIVKWTLYAWSAPKNFGMTQRTWTRWPSRKAGGQRAVGTTAIWASSSA